MADVKCAALHAVPLPDGRLLAPGRTATGVDVTDVEVRTYLDTGALVALTAFDLDSARVDEVLAWVADDPERAACALTAEKKRQTPRTTLVERLEPLLDSPANHTPED